MTDIGEHNIMNDNYWKKKPLETIGYNLNCRLMGSIGKIQNSVYKPTVESV